MDAVPQVAWVRRKGAGRALPRAHLQADLDIATLPGSSPSETLLADAEVIRAVAEVRRAASSISVWRLDAVFSIVLGSAVPIPLCWHTVICNAIPHDDGDGRGR